MSVATYYNFKIFSDRILFVIDAPRRDIYAGSVPESSVAFLNRMLVEAAERNGFEVLDLTASMDAEYQARGLPFNTDLDHHWNRYGHEFVAAQILKAFFGDE